MGLLASVGGNAKLLDETWAYSWAKRRGCSSG
jgi:hypothetical protein